MSYQTQSVISLLHPALTVITDSVPNVFSYADIILNKFYLLRDQYEVAEFCFRQLRHSLHFTEPAGTFCGHKIPSLFHPSPEPEQSNPHSSIMRNLKTKGDPVQDAVLDLTLYLLLKIVENRRQQRSLTLYGICNYY